MLRAAIAALPHLRREAALLMRDTVTLTHDVAGTPLFSVSDGYSSVTAGTAYYTGPGEVREPSPSANQLAAEQLVPGTRWQGRIPFSVTDVADGDLLTVTASPDPDLVGTSFRVALNPPSANRTARRLVLQRNG